MHRPLFLATRAAVFVALGLVLASCSTLTSWFTPQGVLLSQGRTAAQQGHWLEASALAARALSLDADWKDARQALVLWYPKGQDEFRVAIEVGRSSTDPSRWEDLYRTYQAQNTLADLLPGLGVEGIPPPDPVAVELAEASRNAAQFRWDRGRTLLDQASGPREARRALAEGRRARDYDPQLTGLEDWIAEAEAASTQRVLVIPFFQSAAWTGGNLSSELGSRLSSRLARDPEPPELTTWFSSDRLVTLPGGGPARLGLVSLPDARKLAREANQNLVLMGQITQLVWTPPRSKVTVEKREATVTVVTPDHPAGVTKVLKATVTRTDWVQAGALTAQWQLIDALSGAEVGEGARTFRLEDSAVVVTYVGDEGALTDQDRQALRNSQALAPVASLVDRLLDRVCDGLVPEIRSVLR